MIGRTFAANVLATRSHLSKPHLRPTSDGQARRDLRPSFTKRTSTAQSVGLILVAFAIFLVGGLFVAPNFAWAVKGEGTATIDGGANVNVDRAVSHTFTVVLTVGASGITVDADNPTFTLPSGFTAPNASPVATAGDVVSDGEWSALGGTTCPVTMGSSSAAGQVMTVDVTTVCTVGTGGIITLTYKGTSGVAMGATALTIMTADDAGVPTPAIALTGGSPTITVNDTPPATAPLTVTIQVENTHGGTLGPSDFPLSIYINNSPTAYVALMGIPVGASYTVLETLPVGYSRRFNGNCSGVVSNTNPLLCTITNLDNTLLENTSHYCSDGIDNDIDSLADLTDISCLDFLPRLTIITNMVNNAGGVKQPSDFTVHVTKFGNEVSGSPATGVTSSGTAYPLVLGTYLVSEDIDAAYTQSFSGDCDSGGSVTLATSANKTCTITNTNIGVPPPPAGGSSNAGGSNYSTLSSAYFYGQAYQGGTVKLLARSEVAGVYESILPTSATVDQDGKFQIRVQDFLQASYFFAIQAIDKDGRESRILPVVSEFLPLGSNLIVKDILVPPTTEVPLSVITEGQPIKILGYAAPGSVVEASIDNIPWGQMVSSVSGFYEFATTTSLLTLADHTIKARYTLSSGMVSDFSLERVFRISSDTFLKTDLNNDGVIDISDWSIFLFRWGETDTALKSTIDFNGDGLVDISDYSIFLDAM
ncbi:MAG: hypothetical protein Q7S52_04725 [bacterium]|nr:hypothetical protein [bacterium]